jgi:hypothetical protein
LWNGSGQLCEAKDKGGVHGGDEQRRDRET